MGCTTSKPPVEEMAAADVEPTVDQDPNANVALPVEEQAPVTIEEEKVVTWTVPKTSAGWIMKEGQKVKNWKRRFFILAKGRLTYYEKEESKGSNKGVFKLGELDLKGYSIEQPITEQMLLVCKNDDKQRKLKLECEDADCRAKWMTALIEHINWRTNAPTEVTSA